MIRRGISLFLALSMLAQSLAPAFASDRLNSVEDIQKNLEKLKKFKSVSAPLDLPSDEKSTAAGILHWAIKDGKTYILMGKRNDSKDKEIGEWCNFGGKSSKKFLYETSEVPAAPEVLVVPEIPETIVETAVREVQEESNGIFATHPRLLRKTAFTATYTPKEQEGLLYYMYWQKVQYLESKIFKDKVNEAKDAHHKEYTDFLWVDADLVLKAVQQKSSLLEIEGRKIEIFKPFFQNLSTDSGLVLLSELSKHKKIRRFNKSVRPYLNRLYVLPDETDSNSGKEEPQVAHDSSKVDWDVPVPSWVVENKEGKWVPNTLEKWWNPKEQQDKENDPRKYTPITFGKDAFGRDTGNIKQEKSDFAEAVAAHGMAMVQIKRRLQKDVLPQAELGSNWNPNCEETLSRIHLRGVLGKDFKAPKVPNDKAERRAADIENIKAYFDVCKPDFQRTIDLLESDYEFFADILESETENRAWPTFFHGATTHINNLYKSFTYLRELIDVRSLKNLMVLRGTDIYFKDHPNMWGMLERLGTSQSLTSNLMLFVNFVLFAGLNTTTSASSSPEYVINNHNVAPPNIEEKFEESLALAGFENPIYAYFHSIYQQFIEFKNKTASNSVMYTISQSLEGLDDRNYPCHPGGSYCKDNKSTQKVLGGIQGELAQHQNCHQKCLKEKDYLEKNSFKTLFPENRIFLHPKAVMDPTRLIIKDFLRFPLSKEEEMLYDKEMRFTTVAMLADWLAQETCVIEGSFVNPPLLKELYKRAYKGITNDALEEKPSIGSLIHLILNNHAPALRGFLDSYQEVLQNLNPSTFKSRLTYITETSLLNALVPHRAKLTGELLDWFNNLVSTWKLKSTSTIMGLLKGGNINLFSFIIENIEELTLEYMSQEDISSLLNALKENKTLKRLLGNKHAIVSILNSLMLEESHCLRGTPWFDETMKLVLKESDVYFSKSSYHNTFYPFMNIILNEKSLSAYRNEPTVVEYWNTMLRNLGSFIQDLLKEKHYGVLAEVFTQRTENSLCLNYVSIPDTEETQGVIQAITSNNYLTNITLSGVEMPFLMKLLKVRALRKFDCKGCYLDEKQLTTFAQELKDNSTLETLTLEERQFFAVLDALLETDGPFRDAPWFKGALRKITQKPPEALKATQYQKRSNIVSAILEECVEEVVYKEHFSYILRSDEFASYIRFIESNRPFKNGCLNISGVHFDENAMRSLATALSKNKTVKTLKLNECELSTSLIDLLCTGLRQNSTLTSVQLSKESKLDVIHVLDEMGEGPFRQTPWFIAAQESARATPVETIQRHLTQKRWAHISPVIATTTIGSLDFTNVEFDYKDRNQWKEVLINGLRENSTLEAVTFVEGMDVDIVLALLASPDGPFAQAPWFVRARAAILTNPISYMTRACRNENVSAMLSILKHSPQEIELKHFTTRGIWIDALAEGLSRDENYVSLNFSGAHLYSDVEKLIPALRVNTRLQSLNLSACGLYGSSLQSLSESLRDNKTLGKLTLSPKDMIAVIGHLMKAPEGAFRQAPWFVQTWAEIISNPQENIKLAIEQKCPELVENIMRETTVTTMDLTPFDRGCSDFWIDSAFNGLKENKTIQRLKVPFERFGYEEDMGKLSKLMQANSVISHYEFGGRDRLNDSALLHFIDTLKVLKTLPELTFSNGDIKLQLLNALYPNRDQLTGGLKSWVEVNITDLLANHEMRLNSCLTYGLTNLIQIILEPLTELKLRELYSGKFSPMCESLKLNKTIRVIDLEFPSWSGFFTSPIKELREALHDAPHIHTVRLGGNRYIDEREAKEVASLLRETKGVQTVDLSQAVMDSKGMSALVEGVRFTQFVKVLKVPEKNERDLLEEVISCENMPSEWWRTWRTSAWEKVCTSLEESLSLAIESGHKNLATAILKTGNVRTLDLKEKYLDEKSRAVLVDVLMGDSSLQTLILGEKNDKILMKLLPHKESLSKGAKAWVQNTVQTIMQAPGQWLSEALRGEWGGNEDLARYILKSCTSIEIPDIGSDKIIVLSKLLADNTTLESLTLVGDLYEDRCLKYLYKALRENAKLPLKRLDLSQCVLKHENTTAESLEDLKIHKNDLTIIACGCN
ncbi:MAG: NUDIX hydrolase [Alphaproteobacteria bacterium]|jgi:hypothetical protein|nr:NUDIX hydrolase [Alphaproteobacteria bacterium]